jgi:hypothetical protein
MRAHGSEVIGEMQYEDTYQLASIRGPEGIIVALPSSSAKACRVASETRVGNHPFTSV